jgi:hypothetical protein
VPPAGVGFAIVRSFALSGASNIAIIARNYPTLSTVTAKLRALSLPLNVLPFPFGVTVVSAAMEEVVKRFEAIDVLVNNMAVFEPYVKIADSDQDIWWQTFQVNLKGMYLVTRAALPSSRENKHTIVNVTSNLPVHFSSLKEFQPMRQASSRCSDSRVLKPAATSSFEHSEKRLESKTPIVRDTPCFPGSPVSQQVAMTRASFDIRHDFPDTWRIFKRENCKDKHRN